MVNNPRVVGSSQYQSVLPVCSICRRFICGQVKRVCHGTREGSSIDNEILVESDADEPSTLAYSAKCGSA